MGWKKVGTLNNYRPQRSCEGYVFTRVCHSIHSGGGGGAIPACIADGIPACLAAGGCLLRGGVETSQKQTATVADGMHPTGMHSYLCTFHMKVFSFISSALLNTYVHCNVLESNYFVYFQPWQNYF